MSAAHLDDAGCAGLGAMNAAGARSHPRSGCGWGVWVSPVTADITIVHPLWVDSPFVGKRCARTVERFARLVAFGERASIPRPPCGQAFKGLMVGHFLPPVV
jgi:hypothetical protein